MSVLPRVTAQTSGESLSIELPRAAGLKAGAPLTLISHGPDGVLLLRDAVGRIGYFAGDLTSVQVAEVVGWILSGIKSGRLVLSRGSVRKTVTFRDGQVVFATSTAPDERLGTFLVRRKLITAKQLEDALARVKPGVKLGQVLTQSKVLSPANLYAAMTELVKEIAVGIFELADGQFLFLEGGPLPEDAVKLPERTRDVMLEGLKRGDDLIRLRHRFPPMMRVQQGPGAPPAGLEALVSLAARGAELLALQAGFHGKEYAFLTAIERLFAAGALVEEKPAPVAPVAAPPMPSAVELYSSLIRSICAALQKSGKDLSDLHSFFADPLPGLEDAFAGVVLSDDGTLDVERVFENLKQGDPVMARAKAFEALDAFVSYALFSAKNVLPPDLAQVLAAEFRRLQEGIGG